MTSTSTFGSEMEVPSCSGVGSTSQALRRLVPVLRRHWTGVVLTVFTSLGNQIAGIVAAVIAASVTGRVAAGTELSDLRVWLVALDACSAGSDDYSVV